MSLEATIEHVKSTRSRLRNPPNAVPDHGINLRPIEPVQHIEIVQAPPQVSLVVPPEVTERVVALNRLDRRIRLLNRLMERLEQRRGSMVRALQPSIEKIMKVTCAYFDVSYLDMQSPRRQHRIVRPRQIAAYIAKQLTTQSLPQIGRRMGRDHTTILSSVRKVEELKQKDEKVAEAIRVITASLEPVV